jgi:DNA-binding beta-propeller fold protein YncE
MTARAYMVNNATSPTPTVTVINTSTNSIMPPTSGIPVGDDGYNSVGVAFTPDGTKAFVVNYADSPSTGSIRRSLQTRF